jgi:hypothetical protein
MQRTATAASDDGNNHDDDYSEPDYDIVNEESNQSVESIQTDQTADNTLPEDSDGLRNRNPEDSSDLIRSYIEKLKEEKAFWSVFPPVIDDYIDMTVVVDLDRQVLTLRSGMHYDLHNIPRTWASPPETMGIMEESINRFSHPRPTPNHEYTDLYETAKVDIYHTPGEKREQDAKRAMIVEQLLQSYHRRTQDLLAVHEFEWGPNDIQFRYIVYGMVNIACWGKYTFKTICAEERDNLNDIQPDFADFLRGYDVPSTDTYWMTTTCGKDVLIHLSTHLDENQSDAIGRVINYAIENNRTELTACIISLQQIIRVNITLDGGHIRVEHTLPRYIDGDLMENGIPEHEQVGWAFILFETLSPFVVLPFFNIYNTNLPPELLLEIFSYLFLDPDGILTLPNLRFVCKACDNLVRNKTLSLPGLTLFGDDDLHNHNNELYRGVDTDGNLGWWCMNRDPDTAYFMQRIFWWKIVSNDGGKLLGPLFCDMFEYDLDEGSTSSTGSDSEEGTNDHQSDIGSDLDEEMNDHQLD